MKVEFVSKNFKYTVDDFASFHPSGEPIITITQTDIQNERMSFGQVTIALRDVSHLTNAMELIQKANNA